MRKNFATLLAILVVASLLAGCGPTDRQQAAEDCLVFGNKAACAYVDALKGVQETSNEIQEKEDLIKEIEDEIKVLKTELKADEKSVDEFKELWEASKKPPKESEPPAPKEVGDN